MPDQRNTRQQLAVAERLFRSGITKRLDLASNLERAAVAANERHAREARERREADWCTAPRLGVYEGGL